jgi:hypothetical protein
MNRFEDPISEYEGDIFVKENTERLKFHYVYCNNEISGRPIVFECDAFDILEADDLYEKALGVKPERQNHIGCSVIKL